MATPFDKLHKISEQRSARLDKALRIAENMRRQADEAARASGEVKTGTE